jgi:hypothetical protein
MTAMTFATFPVEVAYTRRVLFALELLDPATLALVSDEQLRVAASGLAGKPIRNRSGRFVWLEEGATPQRVTVDPGDLPYESEDWPAPLPPARLLRIVLRPTPAYPIDSGVSAVASSLYESIAPTPVGVAGADVWLQWVDASGGPGGPWVDAAPPRSRSAPGGDFVALLRLDAGRVPELDAGGRLRARLAIDRAGVSRTSPEFFLSQGRRNDLAPFAWDQL